MPSEILSADVSSKDEPTSSPKKNPCGMCRANGLRVCKGHGGGAGGGGGGGGSSDSSDNQEGLSTSPSPKLKPKTLQERLAENLISTDGLDSVFIFENQDALFTMKLDMDCGSIIFCGKKDLSKNQQATLDEFFNTIKTELSAFKKELIKMGEDPKLIDKINAVHVENVLTLKFPSPKYYDAFVERLIDKNLIFIEPVPQQEKIREAVTPQLLASPEDTEPSHKSTAPTPFDIRPEPKPKD